MTSPLGIHNFKGPLLVVVLPIAVHLLAVVHPIVVDHLADRIAGPREQRCSKDYLMFHFQAFLAKTLNGRTQHWHLETGAGAWPFPAMHLLPCLPIRLVSSSDPQDCWTAYVLENLVAVVTAAACSGAAWSFLGSGTRYLVAAVAATADVAVAVATAAAASSC